MRLGILHVVGLGALLLLAVAFAGGRHSKRDHVAKPAERSAKARLAGAYGRLPLAFEPNRGQSAGSVRFLAHGSDFAFFVTGDDTLLYLHGPIGKPSVVRTRLVGANPRPAIVPEKKLPGRVNYLLGNDPSRWRIRIPSYARLVERSVYRGVDLAYHGERGSLEFDFLLQPGADPSAIALAFMGVQAISLDRAGDLRLALHGGDLRERRPVAYQLIGGAKRFVSARFQLRGKRVGFALGRYDRHRPLVIDPTFGYSTFHGGSGNDRGNAIAVDSSGNAYVTGDTTSIDFPTANAGQPTLAGGTDAFVTKLNADGSALVYSTYMGGSGNGLSDTDSGQGIAVDENDAAYVAGTTTSKNFPTLNPLQAACAGSPPDHCQDAFVTKLSPSGTLVYSTFLGGSSDEYGRAVALDSTDNAYVTGETDSIADFPVVNPLPGGASSNGGAAFVSKLNASGNALIYSTYLGQPLVFPKGSVSGFGIAVDSADSAYVTGSTNSRLLPTTANAFQTTIAGVGNPPPSDAFVSKLAPSGSSLVYSTYLGASGDERGTAIAVDSSGSAYVTGKTGGSPDFPVLNAVQPSCNLSLPGTYCTNDAFVTKFSPDGSALVYSTFLGSPNDDFGNAIAVDPNRSAVVTGSTAISCCSPNFPAVNPLQEHGFDLEGFVSKLSPSGDTFMYSSFLGGCSGDEGRGITVDTADNTYVTGWTVSRNFPTANPLQATLAGGSDAFIAKIGAAPSAPRTISCGSQQNIVVRKQTLPPGSSQPFSFLVGGDEHPEGIGPPFLLKDGESQTIVPPISVNPGFYFVRETPVSGWDTSASCNDGSPVDKITLDAGETVTCTFVNTERGTATVVKTVNGAPPSGTQESFLFGLRDGASPSAAGTTLEQRAATAGNGGIVNFTSTLVPGKTYALCETIVAPGWTTTLGPPFYVVYNPGGDVSTICTDFTVKPGEARSFAIDNTPPQQRGRIIVKKVTEPDGSKQQFTFTPSYGSTYQLMDGGSNDSGELAPGSYSVGETALSGWDLKSATCDNGNLTSAIKLTAGKTVSCTFTNVQRGAAKVVKTVTGVAPSGSQSFAFQLRQGSSATSAGAILESANATAENFGVVIFATKLVAGSTYALCEVVMPGWSTTLPPPQYAVYNPSGDNSMICSDFKVAAGETKSFAIDNTPPPGGSARTIGFWKNWASCATSNGKQKSVLDQTLALAEPAGLTIGTLTLHGSTSSPNKSPDCSRAVRLLDKSTIDSNKKMASDPAFGLAAQQLAAKLDVRAGAATCGSAAAAISSGQSLLAAIHFNGSTHDKLSATQTSQANALEASLDKYNNNNLC